MTLVYFPFMDLNFGSNRKLFFQILNSRNIGQEGLSLPEHTGVLSLQGSFYRHHVSRFCYISAWIGIWFGIQAREKTSIQPYSIQLDNLKRHMLEKFLTKASQVQPLL